jgi:predicted GNAT family acetyltransferase
MKYADLQLKFNAASDRIELEVDGSTAFIQYKLLGKTLFLIHTEVPPELEGKGVGTAIVGKALQYAQDNSYKVIPLCVFVQSYLKRHPEWNDIIASNDETHSNKH